MVEYPHLPDGIVTTVLPEHFNVQVSPFERERMMNTTRMYSKVLRAQLAGFKQGDAYPNLSPTLLAGVSIQAASLSTLQSRDCCLIVQPIAGLTMH